MALTSLSTFNEFRHIDQGVESRALSAISEHESDVGRYVATVTDIIKRKEAEDRLRHRASSEPFTDRLNRAPFFDHMQQALSQGRRYSHNFALLYLDLDHFKAVNDADRALYEAKGNDRNTYRFHKPV